MKNFIFISINLFFLFLNLLTKAQKQEGIALTPPMGWNSWNCFREELDESKIMEIADAMVCSGMRDAGYEYIIIDDGWMTNQRDPNGHVIVDSIKFPSGMKALGDYIHNLGLKFGIYSSPGRFTCQYLMGSYGHEQIDANDYAAWGVDYLKYDWCKYPSTKEVALATSVSDCRASFELMRDCLRKTGRPIIYSVHVQCVGWGTESNSYPWVTDVAHLHRSSDDIKDNWDRMLYCLNENTELWKYAGPGFWNDPDMLEVGNTTQERLWGGIDSTKMTTLEYRTHFSMWCMMAAPLIAGNDLRSMSPEINEILTNEEIIAIDQDPLGKQGKRIRVDGNLEVWCKELSGNRKAIALLNCDSVTADISIGWEELGISGKHKVRDLWEKRNLGNFRNSFTGRNISPHESMILLIY